MSFKKNLETISEIIIIIFLFIYLSTLVEIERIRSLEIHYNRHNTNRLKKCHYISRRIFTVKISVYNKKTIA